MKKKTVHQHDTPVVHANEYVSLEEQIAQRAHTFWCQRGRTHGSNLADWLQAEREINKWHQLRLRETA
jgi:hypothetical protein